MSELRIIGAPVSAQRPWLFSRVAESRSRGRSVVVFVPEQVTLQAERDLLTGLGLPGLLNLDVLSPTRLKTLVKERAGCSGRPSLDETGRAMALHQAFRDCGDSLAYYRHLSSFWGAVSRMDRTLSELREEDLSAEALEDLAASSRGVRKVKYQDLSRIWRSYDALLEDRFDDPADAWRDTCRRLPASGLWQGIDLYVYGFDTIRPDLRELLLSAVEVCSAVQVLLTMTEASSPSGRIFRVQRDSAANLLSALEEKGVPCSMDFVRPAPSKPGDVLGFLERHMFSEGDAVFSGDPSPALTLYAAAHPTAEALALVSALLRWHEEGIPWNRMAIALPRSASSPDSLLAALHRHHIPCFVSRKEELGRHGVSQLLSCALLCVSQGVDSEPLLKIACCGFGSLTREEGASLTAYAGAWGIRRNRWRQPFIRGENAPEMEQLRQRLLLPLDHLHGALRASRSARESVEAVYAFLREEGVYEQLLARQDRLVAEERYAEAVVDRQVWDLLMNLLDQLYALLDGRRPSLRDLADLLQGALDQAALSSLPEEEEGVSVGQIGHMIPGRTEALAVPGMNDGVMNVRPESLLSEAERKALEQQAGRALGMNQSRMSLIVRSDYARTFAMPEKRLFVSYCLRSEGGKAQLPGEPVAELRRLFPDLKEQGGLSWEVPDSVPASPSLALETAAPLLRDLLLGKRDSLSRPWQAALRALLQDGSSAPVARAMLAPLMGKQPSRKISSSSAIRLFHGDRVSISRLECFAACPRQHFLRYGLRPALPKSFEFTPGDAGNFFHAALQRYINRAVRDSRWPSLDQSGIDALMDEILDQLTLPWEEGPLREDALGRWQGEAYLRRVRRAASVLTRFAGNADFQVLGTEVEFGEPGGLPPLVLNLPDGAEIALRGKIDRLDLYRGSGGDYLRVLDLKSSEHRLDPARMNSGEQLQLMIYLQAALRGRPGALPAGALYFPVLDKEVEAETPEAAEEARLKNVQLKGVVLADEEIIRAMDRDITPYSLPKIFNQDGSISKSSDWVIPPEILSRLMEAAQNKAVEICCRIRDGEAAASPSVSETSSPCTFCEFHSVCPVRKTDQRPLPKGLSFGDVGSV